MSDNGPENGAGTAGPYHQRKRSLMEGGIRVPLVAQWVGRIPPGTASPLWAATVDLLPTFLAAAGLGRPASMRLDGYSLLPALLQVQSYLGPYLGPISAPV